MLDFWNRFLLFCALVLFITPIQAQLPGQYFDNDPPKTQSPYSRIGIGDLISNNFANQRAMGGLSAAFHDSYHINITNPASLGFLSSTSFEVGLNASYNKLTSPSKDINSWAGNLSYISLAFPLKNPVNRVLDRKKSPYHWAMNITLLPYSTVGYNVTSQELAQDTITYYFQGDGGTYKLSWGNALRYKRLSGGVNLGYFFGKKSRTQEVRYDNVDNYFFDASRDETRYNGFFWNAGVQYDYLFKKKDDDGKMIPNGKILTIGLYGNSASSFSTSTTRELYAVSPIGRDTLLNDTIRQSGKLPAEFGFGLMLRKLNKYRIGVDFSTAAWSKYVNEAEPVVLKNTFKLAVGGEFIPDFISYNSYAKRIRYRAGFFYQTDPRSDNLNKQLTQYGITFGFGLPIILPREQKSFVNLAFEIGKSGSPDQINTTYFKTTVGFTLNDNSWFYKRKFN